MKFDKSLEGYENKIGISMLVLLSALAIEGCGGGGDEGRGEEAQSSALNTPAINIAAVNTAVADTPEIDTTEADTEASAAESNITSMAPTPVRRALVASLPTAPIFKGYYVKGNRIYRRGTGTSHLFRGVASPSMSWQVKCDHCTVGDFQLMSQGWKANVVRLSVHQKYWLASSAQYNAGYAAELARVVAAIEQAGMDVILDNHGSSSRYMADADSVVFWREVATAYRNDPHVLFELFNEPNGISWDVWLNGGAAPSGPAIHGMQELYNTVRATGALNLVVVGGLNWAYDLSGVPTHRVIGMNIVYNTHPYSFPGKQPADWEQDFGFLAKTDPVISTEFGNFDCSKGYYQSFINYAKSHRMSWTAWGWFPGGCGFPAIVTDWMGTPNAPGEVVKAALLNP